MQTATRGRAALYSPGLLHCRLALGLACGKKRIETGRTPSGAEGTDTALKVVQEVVAVALSDRVR